jgi:hypothetical protein
MAACAALVWLCAPAAAATTGTATGVSASGTVPYWQAAALPTAVIQGGAIPVGWQPQAVPYQGIGPDGRLDAMYFNPGQLPFATAQAALDGNRVRAFFELHAGGYGGSTYELGYDPADDRLKGVYYQAVAKQRFEVYFVRKQAR